MVQEIRYKNKLRERVFIFLLILSFGTNIILINNTLPTSASEEPYFTLTAVCRNSEFGLNELTLIKDQLSNIGINLEITNLNWPFNALIDPPPYVGNYDLTFMGSGIGANDPDVYSFYYTKWGQEATAIYIINYEESLDYNEDLGMGMNEWYFKEGAMIFPQNSQERIDHYWNWQKYLMEDIVPIKPLYTVKNQYVSWSNLLGYNPQLQLFDNWGFLDWDGTHENQTSEDIITYPLVSAYYGFNGFKNQYCLEPLIKFDTDKTIYPHLAKKIEYLDNYTLRIHCREGIKWQDDPVGNFTDEYLDAEDIYFSLVLYKEGFLSSSMYAYDWIDEIQLINETTIDISIDYNSNYFSWGPYEKYYSTMKQLNCLILPEHFLNQTQIYDWPDTSHLSWEIFEQHPFGTGLLEFVNYTDSIEENYEIYPDCWWMDSSITNDPLLNWTNRFGTFTNSPTKLKNLVFNSYELAAVAFESGEIDILLMNSLTDKIESYKQNSEYKFNTTLSPNFRFVGYNLKDRGIIGSRDPCPNNSKLTIGLAVRKALSYVINTVEINNILKGGEWELSYGPISETLGIWYNPNIEKYDYDLQQAKKYLYYAGYGTLDSTVISDISVILPLIFSELLIIIIIKKKEKK